MSPGKRADRAWLAGNTIPWPTFRRSTAPLPSETVFASPALELIAHQIASARRSDILDLGTPRGANIDYLSQYSCVLYFGDLPRALNDDPGMSAPEEERDVEGVVGRVIEYKEGVCFDAVFVWNLFDYFDSVTIRAVASRIGEYCRTGTLLYLMTSNGETIPDEPGNFTIVDEKHLRFQSGSIGTRDGMRYSPRGLERIMPGFRLRHSFMLANDMQDYLFNHE